MNKSFGNSLIEYAVPLVVIFGAGALLVSFSDVPQRINDFMTGTTNGSVVGDEMTVGPLSSRVETLGGSGSLPETLGGSGAAPAMIAGTPHPSPTHNPNSTQGVVIPLESGKAITLPDYPNDISQLIETVGANGTTQMVSAQLMALADQLEATGEATKPEADLLRKLANEGHAMAEAEDTIDWILRSTQGYDEDLLSYSRVGGETGASASQQVGSAGQQRFQALLTQVKTLPAMKNPAIAAVVNSSANRIQSLAQSVSSGFTYAQNAIMSDYTERSGDCPDCRHRLQALVDASISSQVSHLESANICQAGYHKDTGLSCL